MKYLLLSVFCYIAGVQAKPYWALLPYKSVDHDDLENDLHHVAQESSANAPSSKKDTGSVANPAETAATSKAGGDVMMTEFKKAIGDSLTDKIQREVSSQHETEVKKSEANAVSEQKAESNEKSEDKKSAIRDRNVDERTVAAERKVPKNNGDEEKKSSRWIWIPEEDTVIPEKHVPRKHERDERKNSRWVWIPDDEENDDRKSEMRSPDRYESSKEESISKKGSRMVWIDDETMPERPAPRISQEKKASRWYNDEKRAMR